MRQDQPASRTVGRDLPTDMRLRHPVVLEPSIGQQALGLEGPLPAKMVPYAALPGRYQDVMRRIPNITKAKPLLGFSVTVPLAARAAGVLVLGRRWYLGLRAKF